jgi:radical SAM protein with 4Fe4S-binding SPASM domain
MSESDPNAFIGWEDLIYIADLSMSARRKSIGLLGGEPTLHPDFPDIVAYFTLRGFHVQIFTSGIMADDKLDRLEEALADVKREAVSFTCNLNDPQFSPKAETARVRLFLEKFGTRTSPGFNIYRPDFSLDFLFAYINEFGLHRNIRLGIAHPVAGLDTEYISPDQMRAVGTRLASYLPRFRRERVRPGLDCGFVMCMFDDAELGDLFRASVGDLRFGCGPAIDIGPDATVWSCFPLSSHTKHSLFEFTRLDDIHKQFEDDLRSVRVEVAGLYPECDLCDLRARGACSGGCVAHALRAMEHEPDIRKLWKGAAQ